MYVSHTDEEDTRLVRYGALHRDAASLPACSTAALAQDSDRSPPPARERGQRGGSGESEPEGAGDGREEEVEEEEDAEEEAALREILIEQKK